MNSTMRTAFMLIGAFLIAHACADVCDVIGYGSGDDLQQAIVAAKVDAALNAGGRVTTQTEVDREKLVSDGGAVENEIHLLSHKIVETGESFDGAYVRIKAKMSTNGEYPLKDGDNDVEESGIGVSEPAALKMAKSHAILSSGVKIRALAKYEEERLVADEASFLARGVITNCSVLSVVKTNGNYEARVKCRILQDSTRLPAEETAVASGSGQNSALAVATARRNLVMSGAEFVVQTDYKEEAQTSFLTRLHRKVGLMALKAQSIEKQPDGELKAVVGAKILNSGVVPSVGQTADCVGYGRGVSLAAAHQAAIGDAVINSASKVVVDAEYDHGNLLKSKVSFDGVGHYFGETNFSCESIGNRCVGQLVARIGGELPVVAPDIKTSVDAVGYGESVSKAISDAKQRAVDMVFGCAIKTSREEVDGGESAVSCLYEHSNKGYVDEFDVLSRETEFGSHIVKIRATVKNHDGDSKEWSGLKIFAVLFVLFCVFLGSKKVWGDNAFVAVWIVSIIALLVIGHLGVAVAAFFMGGFIGRGL